MNMMVFFPDLGMEFTHTEQMLSLSHTPQPGIGQCFAVE